MNSNELGKLVSDGAAMRFHCRLQPAGGPGDKVFPPTYEGGTYAREKRKLDGTVHECVHLDSVQSQANRMELALLEAIREGKISMPLLEVRFPSDDPLLESVGSITNLDAPHRMADAILRDSELDGVRFRASSVGNLLNVASLAKATGLFEYSPTSLVYGIWDSTGPMGGLGVKFARTISSEIVAFGVEYGVKSSSRIDPLGITLKAGPVYLEDEKTGEWTLEETTAGGKKLKQVGKEGKPSEINHGNIAPSLTDKNGGVTFDFAQQVTVISMPAIRRLRFPVGGIGSPEKDTKARKVLAAIALLGTTLSVAKGIDLRSRTLLVPEQPGTWQAIGMDGETMDFKLSRDEAISLYRECVQEAVAAGLPYHTEPVVLTPSKGLVALVKRSRDILKKGGES